MNFRPAALAAGPVTVLSLVLLVLTFAVEGFESDLAIAESPIAIAASVCAMAGLMLLAFALFRFMNELPSLREGLGLVGSNLAMVGTLLSVGGAWSMVFVLPGLAGMEAGREIASSGIPLVQAGFIASFIILAIGWLLTAVSLVRSDAVPRWTAILLLVGALICILPLPSRFFVIAIAVSVIEWNALGRQDSRRDRQVPVGAS
ncbi:hypothetical protein [Aeromicrobium sp.]|uniref:hypothetical protein n=1 Tax=Aeromicrobium sp. TaxID=1871063 RepID=UPI003D6B4656